MSEKFPALNEAIRGFVEASRTQSQEHIRPLHWHIACRLVIEGGFRPEHITPRPPFRFEPSGSGGSRSYRLVYDESVAEQREAIVLGGLKTKIVDVVVSTVEVGPCLAISVKGSVNAFRNLTNRMEEAVGDCTNLHIAYPALVYGFLHIIKGNYEGSGCGSNDVAVRLDGAVSDAIMRYHDSMSRLAGRADIRDHASRYEAVALAIADTQPASVGELYPAYPAPESALSFAKFFSTLYEAYDLRFVYAAPALKSRTQRLEWAADSPALKLPQVMGLAARIA